MAIYCMHCGKELPADANFCLKCGNPLKAVETPLHEREFFRGYVARVMEGTSHWKFKAIAMECIVTKDRITLQTALALLNNRSEHNKYFRTGPSWLSSPIKMTEMGELIQIPMSLISTVRIDKGFLDYYGIEIIAGGWGSGRWYQVLCCNKDTMDNLLVKIQEAMLQQA